MLDEHSPKSCCHHPDEPPPHPSAFLGSRRVVSLKVWGCFATVGQVALLGPHQKSGLLEGHRAPYRLGRRQEPKDTGQLSPSELAMPQNAMVGITGSGKIRASSFTCSREDSEQVLIWLGLGYLLLMCGTSSPWIPPFCKGRSWNSAAKRKTLRVWVCRKIIKSPHVTVFLAYV